MAQDGSLEQFLHVAVEAAKKAGDVIRQGFHQTKNVEHKGVRRVQDLSLIGSTVSQNTTSASDLLKEFGGVARVVREKEKGMKSAKNEFLLHKVNHPFVFGKKKHVDLVTETDKACEDLIFNHLKQHFPSHKFIGEETTAACGNFELTDEPTWIVDPLDGTTNFVHGFPFVCVSMGLTIGKIPTVGVVYNPIIDELFTAINGKGAFLNGKPIKVSSQPELVKALLATEAGTKRDKLTLDATTGRINSLLFKVRSLRMCGSCALNLCGVACGRLDLFYELEFGGPWDVAGGAVIVKEAGGFVFDPSGSEFDLTARRVAATNAHLKDAFIKALNESE